MGNVAKKIAYHAIFIDKKKQRTSIRIIIKAVTKALLQQSSNSKPSITEESAIALKPVGIQLGFSQL